MKKLLLLLLPFAMISCSSDNDNETVETPQTDAITFIKGTLDGQPMEYSYTESQSTQALYTYATGYSSSGSLNYYIYGGSFVALTDIQGPSITLGWNNMVVGNHTEETAAFPTAFNTIPLNYLTAAQSETGHMKGVEISYQTGLGNASQKFYYSYEGSQSGSTFTVTNSESGTDALTGLKTKTITGTFSCKLYNEDDASDIKTITGGTYKVIVREYN